MCGIAGVVAYRQDAEGLLRPIDAMTRSLARRGPDDEGIWRDRNVALGVRRLSVVDLPGGKQPAVARSDGAVTTVLAYTGEVYNFLELRQELASLGHRFETDSDTEVVLRAHVEWGADAPRRLNGMFAYAVWDARREELLLVRDRAGIYPLHYAIVPGGLLFGSEQKAILAHPAMEARVDLDGMRELASLARTPGHAVFAGMRELEPGRMLRFGRDGSSLETFWRLEPREHEDDLDTTIRTIRELLEDIVARQLVADVPLAFMLSGGLDSSAVVALAHRVRPDEPQAMRTFAVDFAGADDHFRAVSFLRSTRDAPYAEEVARHVGSHHSAVVLSPEALLDRQARSDVVRARDLPTPLGDLYTSLLLLSAVVRRDSTVVLTGDASDELFGGYNWASDPASFSGDTFPWVTAARNYPSSDRVNTTALLAPDLRRQLDIAAYEAERYREAVAEVEHLPGATPEERRNREVCYVDLTRYRQIIMDRKDRMGMAVALEGRVPFTDHRLVEYVYNVPLDMKTFDGREKALLRAAVEDLLPSSVLDRQKAGYPITQDPAYEDGLRALLAEMLDDPSSPVAPLVDEERARECLGGDDGDVVDRSSMELVLQLNDWAREYGVAFAF